MKFETRLELIIGIVVVLVVGGWIGIKLTRKAPEPAPSAPAEPTPEPTPAAIEPTPQPEPAAPVQPEPAPTPEPTAAQTEIAEGLAQAKSLLNAEKAYEARKALTDLILVAQEGAQREEIKRLLDTINARLFFSRERSEDSIVYKIERGDSLNKIALRQGKDGYYAELLQRLNGIKDAGRIRVGMQVKIPRGTFSVRVEKGGHRLIVFLNGHYIKEYPIAIGAPLTPTPVETFQIASKKKNPQWYAPDGNVYPYGHPKNVLGTRWLGFNEKAQYQSYGIHGTADPDSIGQNVSNGCVRMLNKDVEELFSMLSVGENVAIVP